MLNLHEAYITIMDRDMCDCVAFLHVDVQIKLRKGLGASEAKLNRKILLLLSSSLRDL